MTDDRPSLGTLVAGITAELSALVRGEIELAKAEMRESAKAGAAGAALFVVAGVLLAMVWLLVTWAVVYVLVEVADLPTWASFLIVAGFYLLVAIILGAVGLLPAQEGSRARDGAGRDAAHEADRRVTAAQHTAGTQPAAQPHAGDEFQGSSKA